MNAEDISRKVMDAADAVGKKTSEWLEEGKLLFRIREAERGIEKLYGKIGRFLYENNRSLLDGEVGEMAERIDELSQQLTELRRDLAQVSNQKYCENCGTLNTANSAFCNRCGERLE